MRTRRNRKSRKTRKERGGALIGKGAYGCVYKPSIRCRNRPSNNGHITKVMGPVYAQKEFETSKAIAERYLKNGLDVSNDFVLPSEICDVPNNYSPTEEAVNPIQRCNISNLRPPKSLKPTLITMEYGGIALDKFQMNVKDDLMAIPLFLNACVGLLDKLITLHSLNIAHMDIKPANLIIRMKDDEYDIRFIDPGLTLLLDEVNGSAGDVYALNYQIWPFETRFLQYGAGHYVSDKNISDFYNKSVIPVLDIINIDPGYYSGGSLHLLRPISHALHSPRTIDHYLSYYLSFPKDEMIIELGKQTDVYSMGYTLAILFKRNFAYLFPRSAEAQSLYQQFLLNVIVPMMNPNPENRYTAEDAYEAFADINDVVQDFLKKMEAESALMDF